MRRITLLLIAIILTDSSTGATQQNPNGSTMIEVQCAHSVDLSRLQLLMPEDRTPGIDWDANPNVLSVQSLAVTADELSVRSGVLVGSGIGAVIGLSVGFAAWHDHHDFWPLVLLYATGAYAAIGAVTGAAFGVIM